MSSWATSPPTRWAPEPCVVLFSIKESKAGEGRGSTTDPTRTQVYFQLLGLFPIRPACSLRTFTEHLSLTCSVSRPGAGWIKAWRWEATGCFGEPGETGKRWDWIRRLCRSCCQTCVYFCLQWTTLSNSEQGRGVISSGISCSQNIIKPILSTCREGKQRLREVQRLARRLPANCYRQQTQMPTPLWSPLPREQALAPARSLLALCALYSSALSIISTTSGVLL